jgi:predicted phage terminase large subunit-like protein
MQTRWHEDDLSGRLLAQGGWEHINLPAMAEDGTALWPEWFPVDVLNEIKREIGSYDWEALYQGRPSPRGGGIMKISNCGRYDPGNVPTMQRLILAVDTAAKTKDHNDYSICALMGKAGDGIYILGIWRQRAEYPALKAAIQAQFEQYRPDMICIEDSSAGTAVIQELRLEGLPVKPVRAVADKVTRATPLSAGVECGRLKLPSRAPWLQDLETELGQFPAGKHDDQVDALALGYAELHMAAAVANIANPMFTRRGPLDPRRR